MYGSNFCSWTVRPRETSSRPIDAAAMPLPSEETTPPVMKMKRVSLGELVAARRGSWAIDRTSSVVDLATVAPGADASPAVAGRASGRAQQRSRVSACCRVALTRAEHPHQLAHDPIAVERTDRGLCGKRRGVLCDREVAGGERRDLGQVSDAQDLAIGRELA